METIIATKRIKNNVYAYKYINGTISIDGTKYLYHSMTSAIQAYRQKNKK